MITLLIILGLLGMVFFVLSVGATLLLDPLIAILIIVGIYKLIKLIVRKIKG